MIKEPLYNWEDANQRYLMAAIAQMQAELELNIHLKNSGKPGEDTFLEKLAEAGQALEMAGRAMPSPSALQRVENAFGLSTFERKILLMCAAVELKSDFAGLIAGLQLSHQQPLPAFGLAMSVFSDAHWSAISPDRPLRYWRLVELKEQALVTASPLRIDEHILHYLTGISVMPEVIAEISETVLPENSLAHSQQLLTGSLVRFLQENQSGIRQAPAVLLQGEQSDKAAIAARVAQEIDRKLLKISAYSIPVDKHELAAFTRALNRETLLNTIALLLDCTGLETGDKMRNYYICRFIEQSLCPMFVSVDRWVPKLEKKHRIADVQKPARGEQLMLWKEMLGPAGTGLNGQVEGLVSQFNLSARTIRQVGEEMAGITGNSSNGQAAGAFSVKEALWKMCSRYSRPQVDDLAQRIEPAATWDNIVLPDAQVEILHEIAMQVRQRKKVYEEWGFGRTSSRGLGISALFTGESGTGKTMAAEVLANDLNLDLYRIDLSQVVNKYIGETEKNLSKIFDSAEGGGALLLFDEADALFGKRSEVKDSHDRYGNIEVSYLLQRMETYSGLAILTTNMKNALDKAFLRRIRFVVQFPFPGMVQRAAIWSRIFPENTPQENLDWEKLARLSLPGGNIRNIALNAAFIAAEDGLPVAMHHILRAAKTEYAKLDKTMSGMEI